MAENVTTDRKIFLTPSSFEKRELLLPSASEILKENVFILYFFCPRHFSIRVKAK